MPKPKRNLETTEALFDIIKLLCIIEVDGDDKNDIGLAYYREPE